MQKRWQVGIAAFVMMLSAVFGVGATQLPADTGYAGIGSAFMPAVVAVLLLLVGSLLMWQAFTGGFRNFTDGVAELIADHRGALWVTVGIMATAALMTKLGFVIASSASHAALAAKRGFAT